MPDFPCYIQQHINPFRIQDLKQHHSRMQYLMYKPLEGGLWPRQASCLEVLAKLFLSLVGGRAPWTAF